MRINRKFIEGVIDVLDKLLEGKQEWTGRVEFYDKESGFKFALYEINRHYYRLDFQNKKGQWLENLLIQKEEVNDDKEKQD